MTDDLLAQISGARIYDLAQPLGQGVPTIPHHAPFRMALPRRHGDAIRPLGLSGANELITLGGHTGTHVDALCHISRDGLLHGSVDASAACQGGRYALLGAETIAPVVGRGVLLDVPAALGLASLAPAQAVSADDLRRTAEHHDVEVRPGDAVLVRTGWPVGRFDEAEAFLGHATGVPGPDASAAAWLGERGALITGSDTIAYEWLDAGAGLEWLPVHLALLVDLGIPIIEVMDLEALARDRVREFLFVAAPLRLVGATGSPLRPLAVVP